MNIIDNENLMPDKTILEVIVRNHPFCKNLCNIINNLIIKLSTDPTEKINFDLTTKDVILYIFNLNPA